MKNEVARTRSNIIIRYEYEFATLIRKKSIEEKERKNDNRTSLFIIKMIHFLTINIMNNIR